MKQYKWCMMNKNVMKEIQKAIVQKKVYTDFREFMSDEEHSENPVCSCGRKAIYIAYCTMMKAVCTLCENCYEYEQREKTE